MNASVKSGDMLGVEKVVQNVEINNKTIYIANCPAHDWQGMYRDSYNEALLDLQGHIKYFPDESHSGSGIVQQ